MRVIRWVAVAFVLAAYLGVVHHFRSKLHRLEGEAGSLKTEVTESSPDADFVKNAGARWSSLNRVLEPKRYPLAHLDHLSRVMPAGGLFSAPSTQK